MRSRSLILLLVMLAGWFSFTASAGEFIIEVDKSEVVSLVKSGEGTEYRLSSTTEFKDAYGDYMLSADAGYKIYVERRTIDYYDYYGNPVFVSGSSTSIIGLEDRAIPLRIEDKDKYLYTVTTKFVGFMMEHCSLSIDNPEAVSGMRTTGHTLNVQLLIPLSALYSNSLWFDLLGGGSPIIFSVNPKSDFYKRHKHFYSVTVDGVDVPYEYHEVRLQDFRGEDLESYSPNQGVSYEYYREYGYRPRLTYGCRLTIQAEYPNSTCNVTIKGADMQAIEVYPDFSYDSPETVTSAKANEKISVKAGSTIKFKPDPLYDVKSVTVLGETITKNEDGYYVVEDIPKDITIDFDAVVRDVFMVKVCDKYPGKDPHKFTLDIDGTVLEPAYIEIVTDIYGSRTVYSYLVQPGAELFISYPDNVLFMYGTYDENGDKEHLPINGKRCSLGKVNEDREYEFWCENYNKSEEKVIVKNVPDELVGLYSDKYKPVREGSDLTLTVPIEEKIYIDVNTAKWDIELKFEGFRFNDSSVETIDDNTIRYYFPSAISYGTPKVYMTANYLGTCVIKSDRPDLITDVKYIFGTYQPHKYSQWSESYETVDCKIEDWSKPITPPIFDTDVDFMLAIYTDHDKYYITSVTVDGVEYGRDRIVASRIDGHYGAYAIPMPGARMTEDHEITITSVERITPYVRLHFPERYDKVPIPQCDYTAITPNGDDNSVEWRRSELSERGYKYSYGIGMGMDFSIPASYWETDVLKYFKIAKIVSASGIEVEPQSNQTILLNQVTEDYDIYMEPLPVSDEDRLGKYVYVNLPAGVTDEDAGVKVLVCAGHQSSLELGDLIFVAPKIGDNSYAINYTPFKYMSNCQVVVAYNPEVVRPDGKYSHDNDIMNCHRNYILNSISNNQFTFSRSDVERKGTVAITYGSDVPDYVSKALGSSIEIRRCKEYIAGYIDSYLTLPKYVTNPQNPQERYEINSIVASRTEKTLGPTSTITGKKEWIETKTKKDLELCEHTSPYDSGCFEGEHYRINTYFFLGETSWYGYEVFVNGEVFSKIDGPDVADQVYVTGNNGRISIVGADEADTVRVFNMAGMTMYVGQEHTIDGLAPGIYIVQVGAGTFKVRI